MKLRYICTELEGTGLLTAITAYKRILKTTHFVAVVDHSALVHIMRSKLEPQTARLKKLVVKLSA